MKSSFLALAALLVLMAGTPLACQISLSPTVPEAVGLNIHFTRPRPGEMRMLAASGVRWVRMDFNWRQIEKSPGLYDFSEYDALLSGLDPYQIRPVFILAYSNPLYDGDLSPHTDAGRQAFANWVAASVRHFRGRGIVWEMYNEPNWATFWRPRPNVDDYIKLALAVGEAIQQNAPGETYVGPATAVIDPPFVEACLKAGLLNYWSAVSVHPYRQADPETAAADFRNLRLMIARYAPKGKRTPIVSGEWGYSSAWPYMNEQKQGEMLAREWLTDVSNSIPLSIWYDWHDDGTNPKDPEAHFGTTKNRYEAGHEPVYQPKPAYLAARTLTSFFRDDRFSKRLAVGSSGDYVLLFTGGARTRLAAWTTSSVPHDVTIPASPGSFDVVGLTGETLPSIHATQQGLHVRLTGSPQYFASQTPNRLLQLAAAADAAPLEVLTHAPGQVTVTLRIHNPFSRSIKVRAAGKRWTKVVPGAAASLVFTRENIRRDADPIPWRIEVEARGVGRFTQETQIVVSNPLRATLLPAEGNVLPVAVANPSGEALGGGSIEITQPQGLAPSGAAPVEFRLGETGRIVRLQLRASSATHYRTGLRILDQRGNVILGVPVTQFARYPAPVTSSDYTLTVKGNCEAPAESALSVAEPPEGSPLPGMPSLRLSYRFAGGCNALEITPTTGALRAIAGKPRSLGVWIYGDGESNPAFVRFVDATGQEFQEGGGPIDWKRWRYVTFLLDAVHGAHRGGANDGVIHYPIRWDSSFVLTRPASDSTRGTIYISGFTLIY